jgi:outer membrane protein assembly factor BamE (lipoprotein component of BamABCDE complex)
MSVSLKSKINNSLLLCRFCRTFLALSALGIFCLFAGCASTGRQFDTLHVNDVKVGMQDRQTIEQWFGEPYKKATLAANGKGCAERWTYVYAHAVGFGTVTESHALVVDFDSNGKVCDQAYSKLK